MSALEAGAAEDVPAWLRCAVEYYDALDTGDPEVALRSFTDDVHYSRPGFSEDPVGTRIELSGIDALRDLFVHRRGTRASRHLVDRWASSSDGGFVAGRVRGGLGLVVSSFLAEVTYDPQRRRISAYAVMTASPLWDSLDDEPGIVSG